MTNPMFQASTRALRHQLLPAHASAEHCGSITSVESLRRHLQTAVELEHSTIPTYLCALYSIKTGTNAFAYQTIQSVVMEEMLHMILSANLLNAIGGRPTMNHRHFIPEYPTYLPHSNDAFLVPLQKLSKDTLDIFIQIEHPAPAAAPPEADHYNTIGQFYAAIEHALRHFDRVTPGGIFTGDPARQVRTEHYYGSGGKLVAVTNLADAVLAINEIVGQGEGMNGELLDPDHVMFGEEIEYAHYFRYMEIRHERRYLPTDDPSAPPSGPRVNIDWNAVLDMQDNPKMADYPVGSPVRDKTYAFNQTYMKLLNQIHHACNGRPETFGEAVPLMYALKYQALELMNIPTPSGRMAGPSFEFVET
jgi:hypothetical protein